MADRSIKDSAKAMLIRQALSYIEKDPENNIPKLVDFIIDHDKAGHATKQAGVIKKYLDKDKYKVFDLIKRVWTDVDEHQRKIVLENIVINATIIGGPKQQKISDENDCNVPWTILMDPTSACNLHCTGCWAADYGNRLSLSYDELDDIIRQGKELGVYMYLYSGGEPLVRKADIIRLCEAHPDCMFSCFTNGTLIDEAFADEMLRVGNFIPAISIEGDAESTNGRRGDGVYEKVIHAMDLLKERKLMFGASVCYTKENTDAIASDEFWDFLIDKGALFAWVFTFMPVGVDSGTDLIATPEQRKLMYDVIRKNRLEKPLFAIDFWNDGEYVGGCIAGGRAYMHINANGDVEPCAFIHYSDTNIRDHSILDALMAPLFTEYRDGQPFNSNMLRPCPLLDNQGRLAELVDVSGAHSTDMAAPEDVHDLCAKTKAAADAWQPVSEELWGDQVYQGNMKSKKNAKPRARTYK